MDNLDEKDCMILDLLQEDCRMPLTAIAKHVGLSIDSVKKRLEKLKKNKIFYPKIQLRPRNFGYANIVDVRIKIQYGSEKEMEAFLAYLEEHPQVVEIFSISGEWDLSIVLIAKNALDLGALTESIRNRFGRLISSWSASLTIKSHKFEKYNMRRLFEFE